MSGLDSITSIYKYMKTRNKSMTYTIKKIKVTQANATVTVKCKCLDSSKIFEKGFTDLIVYLVMNDIAEYTDEEFGNYLDEVFGQLVDGNKNAYQKKFKTKTFKINMVKQNGKWIIDSINYDLANVVTSNYFTAMKKLGVNN